MFMKDGPNVGMKPFSPGADMSDIEITAVPMKSSLLNLSLSKLG
jgi:hypothetical protein